jgi:lupus La protein
MAGRTESEQSEEQAITGDSAEPPSHLEKQIIRQVEYYYGDHNIVKDKFLRDQVGPNYDKWVPLETMIKFKRLADLSTDFDVIISALQKSTSGLIEISDDRKSIRRSPSHAVPLLTSEYRTETKARTVYAKGFPPEITFDQLQEFFDQHGKIVAIHMRRNAEKEFKASICIGQLTVELCISEYIMLLC